MRSIKIAAVFGALLVANIVADAQTSTDTSKTAPAIAEQLVAAVRQNDDRYRIGTQDVLDIQVFRHGDLNQRVSVSAAGTIVLNRLDKPLVAICKTVSELAAEIASEYKKKFIRDPQVSVSADQKSQPMSIIGAVAKPGTYFVNRKIHLLEMLAMAGGPSQDSGTRLFVARTGSTSSCKDEAPAAGTPEPTVVGLKIRDVQEGKQTFWMEPGDVVSVLDADIVYVYGNVNKQGAIKVREPITLTQAIVSAEGLKPAAKKDKIRILRQRAGALDREELVFDLGQIDKGKVKDPFLEPSDIVAVSEDRMKSILNGLASAVKGTIPNAVYRIP